MGSGKSQTPMDPQMNAEVDEDLPF
jgi:hypothetical protein